MNQATEYLKLLVAAALLGLATLSRWLLDPWLGNHLPYVTFFIAIAVIAWLTTTRIAIASLVVGWLITDYLFVPPRNAFVFAGHDPKYIVGTFTYFAVGATSIITSYEMRRAKARTERAAEAQARLAAIVEWSDDAIISKDLNGIITSWNRGAERIFGYTASEAIGQSITMLIPPERLNEEPGILARIRRGENVDHYETVRRRKDGTLLDISLTVSPLRDTEGRIIGASKISRDITKRKADERLIATHAEMTARALGQRTLELTEIHESLRRTESMAVLGALASGIAHDLANLLLPLRARLQMLQASDASKDKAARPHIDAIAQNVQYIADLAQRIRRYMTDAAREQDSRNGNSTEPVDLASWCRQTHSFLESIVPIQSGIQFKCHIPENLPAIHVNRTALTQAVYNLVQNSVKAMRKPPGVGGTIAVSAAQEDDGSIEIRVEDDGPGMTPEVLAHCMEARFTTDGDRGGNGLGLPLVKAFAESHGGELLIYSPPPGSGQSHGTLAIIRLSQPERRMPESELISASLRNLGAQQGASFQSFNPRET